MLITALEITDYKRVRKVAIAPDADRHLILIGGKNRAGKSSTLDALTAAFGGAKAIAADPVRHGAGEAAIYVELDGGKLTIDRTITPDGKTQIEVRDAEGAVRRPQEVLDRLVGARFLDPLAFLRLSAKDQRADLMKLIPEAERIEELNSKRLRAFDRRTELGRDLNKAKGELARLAEVPVGALVDVAALTAEQRAFGEQQRAREAAGAVAAAAEREAAVANDRLGGLLAQIEDVRRSLAAFEQRVPQLEAELADYRAAADAARRELAAAGEKWAATSPRRDALDAALATANETNAAVFEARAVNKRRLEAAEAVAKLDTDYETCSTAITTIDKRKAEILGGAKLPVDGLQIGDDGILIRGDDGVYGPLSEASASQKWTVAFARAVAGSPGLDDVWLKDGILLDDESLGVVAGLAAAAGKRVWVERGATREAGAIVIQDGMVVP